MADLGKQMGMRMKQIRKAAKMTQERLAERTGLSIEYISRLERGLSQPSFKTLSSLAEVLNVPVKDFFEAGGPVVFRDKKQEGKQKKEYVDQIASELRKMEIRELAVVYQVVRGLADRRGEPPASGD
ncbi:MAG: helix-turn-helix transcriptional regulator [Nitrospirae bacterium]|nr:helix-turn-helix transcriptional regulator [Nitrospirota bacterium]